MKDWVISYLKKNDPGISEELLEKIKTVGFNVFDKEENIFLDEKSKKQDAYLKIVYPLIQNLNCNFEPAGKIKCSNCQKFTLMFISVLSGLSKENFDKLRRSTHIFYVYGTATVAYTKDFSIAKFNRAIDEKNDLKIIVFNHEIVSLPWLLGRFCILNELGRIILSSRDDKYVNEKLREWGFENEVDKSEEFELKRREAISEFYAF